MSEQLLGGGGRDDEMDDGSSSGEVDEGRRSVEVDDVVGKRLWLGSGEVADRGGWGFATGAERLWRPDFEWRKGSDGRGTMT